MKLKIYSQENVLKATFAPDDSSSHQKDLMGDNVLSLSFKHFDCIEIDVNDYIDFDGERFYVFERYTPAQKSTVEWDYSFQLYGIESLIKRVLMLKLVDNEMEPVFSLTAGAHEHAALIRDNMNRAMNTAIWKVGEVILTPNLVIDYSGTYLNEALDALAEAAKTEWWIEGTTINICRCEHSEAITLAYHSGLTSLSRDSNENAKFFTRLFPIGSDRNIDRATYGYTRLQLPERNRYVEQNMQYGIIEHFEEDAFSAIYPRRFGTVGAVRTEVRNGSDGKPFTIYYFTDPTLDFDPNSYDLPGLVKKNIVFQGEHDGEGGELEGRDFEVNFDSAKHEFEIITQFPYDDDTQLPGGSLVPKTGDKYILYNLRMPDEYIVLAEVEFQEAVDKYMEDHLFDRAVYRASTDYIELGKRDVQLSIGQVVRLESAEFFPETGYRLSRIIHVNRKVNNPFQADINISDATERGRMEMLESSVSDIDRYVQLKLGGLPDIIKTWETTLPTDTNLFSARRSLREFLSKKHDDTTLGKLTILGGAEFGNHAAFIDKLGNAEFLSAVVRTILRSPVFVDGMTGEGFGLWRDADGRACLTLDRVTVRQSLVAMELLIEKIRSVGGQIVVSAANGKVKGVRREALGDRDVYVIVFEDENTFVAGDLMRCQTFNGTRQKAYWVEVLSTDATSVTVLKSEFDAWWTEPQPGDEVVLFGSVANSQRQNLISISATEDGQPRVDVLNGIAKKSLEGCLRARLGNLDGIYSDWFAPDRQPKGDGLFADNVYLRGNFILANGDDVKQRFEVMEGRFNSLITADVDNILRNAVFSKNLNFWTSQNLVNFMDSGGYLYILENFYTEKQNIADIFDDGTRNVLRIKNTVLTQLEGDFMIHATPGVHSVELWVLPVTDCTLKIGVEGSELDQTFTLEASNNYQRIYFEANWNATGNFRISCTGTALIYGLKLLDDVLQNSYIHLQTQIDQTREAITLLATKDYVDSITDEIYAHYDALLQITAEGITAVANRITALETASAGWITSADGNRLWASLTEFNELGETVGQHSSQITQLADSIESVVTEINSITGEEIVSRINQTASTVSIDAKHINLTGNITANGNVFINPDGTIVAKGGIFNGFLQMPFVKLSQSDAVALGSGTYRINRNVNIIDDTNNYSTYILLPSDPSFNGVIVSIIGNAGPVITYSSFITFVKTESGSNFKYSGGTPYGNNNAFDANDFPDTNQLRIWGLAQFIGAIDADGNMQWYCLTTVYKKN